MLCKDDERRLIAFGLCHKLIISPLFIISVVTDTRGKYSDSLVTSSIYRSCRYPLFTSWVVFILPGMVLLLNSWIGLTITVFMFLSLPILVIKEETYFESVFVSAYLDYKCKVPCIFPYGLLK